MTNEDAVKNLNRLKHLFTDNCRKIDENTAMDVALSALREQLERDNPKLLTLDELEAMEELAIWVKPICDDWKDDEPWMALIVNGPRRSWAYSKNHTTVYFEDYGKVWLAYRNKPPKELTP